MTDRAKSSRTKASATKTSNAGSKASEVASPGANRVRKHREKMKALGLKPVLLWLPDVNAPGFQDDIRRQCKLLSSDPQEEKILAEIEQWPDYDSWK